MTRKARYLIELVEHPVGEEAARAVRARLENDPTLAKTAKDRARYERDDRWWSVLAGVLIVVMSILYSSNLYTLANIAAVILCLYVVGIFSYIIAKRVLLKRTDPAISPTRALDSLLRKALGMPPRKNDVSRYYDEKAAAEFSRNLAATLVPLSRAAGVEPQNWTLELETNPRLAESALRGVASMPAVAVVTASDQAGSVEFILDLFASFVSTDGGDSIAFDPCPRILDAVAREPRLREDAPSMVSWETCEACGAHVSERYKKAVGGCPVCAEK